jgi:ABC-type nitrate/sulfonate/bicarbonate transport system substrate-binding protein
MKKQGYNVQPSVQLNTTELLVQALSNDQVQFMSSGVIALAAAVDKGINMKVISSRGNNTWNMVSTNDITNCDQLNGKKVALFSTNGTSTAYVNIWMSKNCPNSKPQFLIIPDSASRAQALLTGQIVAAPLETDGTVELSQNHADKYHVLAVFGQVLPGVGRDLVVTNSQTLSQHPTIVKAFIKAQLEAIRAMYKDPTLVAKNDATYLKLGTNADKIAKFYADQKAWCANGGIAPADMDAQLKAFLDYKKVPATVTSANLVDDGPMKAVLAQIGSSTATKC